MSDEPKTEANPEGEPTKKKGKPKLIMILLLLMILGGGGFFTMSKMKGGKPKKEIPVMGKIEELEEFLVNLQGSTSYLKCKVAVGLDKKAEPKMLEEKLPLVRDAILTILMSKVSSDLDTTEARTKLKEEIRIAINQALSEKSEAASADNAHQEQAEHKASPSIKPGGAASSDTAKKPGKTSGKGEPTPPEGPVLRVFFTAFATS